MLTRAHVSQRKINAPVFWNFKMIPVWRIILKISLKGQLELWIVFWRYTCSNRRWPNLQMKDLLTRHMVGHRRPRRLRTGADDMKQKNYGRYGWGVGRMLLTKVMGVLQSRHGMSQGRELQRGQTGRQYGPYSQARKVGLWCRQTFSKIEVFVDKVAYSIWLRRIFQKVCVCSEGGGKA